MIPNWWAVSYYGDMKIEEGWASVLDVEGLLSVNEANFSLFVLNVSYGRDELASIQHQLEDL